MRPGRFFIPRVEYILFAAIFWGIAAGGPRLLNFDGDLPRHILTGDLILQTGEVSTTDLFSYRTVGYPSTPHEWLAQVFFALAHRWLGLSGIVLLTALIIMLTWSTVYSQTIRRSNSFLLSLLLVGLGVAASQIHILPRPHIFTYLLTTIWIWLLEEIAGSRPRAWLLLPLVMLLWVNMHGMFVIGLIILGIYLAGDFLDQAPKEWFGSGRTRAMLAGGALSLAATFISPSGPQIWVAIAALGRSTYIRSRIPEYQSANFHMLETWPFMLILLFVIVGFARTTERVSWRQILLITAFTGLALYAGRMIPLFAIVITPIAAQALAGWIKNQHPESRWLVIEKNIHKISSASRGLVWIPVVILAAAMLFGAGKTIDAGNRGNTFDEPFFPVRAVTWLRDHPQEGRMFNEFDWGGYLLLNLWPEQQVFMDGHTHIYGRKLTREYEKVVTLSAGWEEILAKYDVSWVIVRGSTPLASALSASGNWETAYRDQTAVILIRR